MEKTFLGNKSFGTHPTENLPPLAILKKVEFFQQIQLSSRKKTQIMYEPEKSYYFRRILRQICYLVVKKFQSHNHPNIRNSETFSIGNKLSKKNVRAECMIFLPNYKNCGKN